LANILKSPACGFEVTALHTGGREDERPTLLALKKQIRATLDRAGAGDTVLVFFSGHGGEKGGESYLIPQDCDPAALAGTALAARDLKDWLEASKAGHKLLVLDCCHAGGRSAADLFAGQGGKLVASLNLTENLLTLASCRVNEFSYEYGEKKQGLYT